MKKRTVTLIILVVIAIVLALLSVKSIFSRPAMKDPEIIIEETEDVDTKEIEEEATEETDEDDGEVIIEYDENGVAIDHLTSEDMNTLAESMDSELCISLSEELGSVTGEVYIANYISRDQSFQEVFDNYAALNGKNYKIDMSVVEE
jgi:hypothetical protein